jgi:hypothetical protein
MVALNFAETPHVSYGVIRDKIGISCPECQGLLDVSRGHRHVCFLQRHLTQAVLALVGPFPFPMCFVFLNKCAPPQHVNPSDKGRERATVMLGRCRCKHVDGIADTCGLRKE